MEHVSFISSIIIRHAGPLASMLAPQYYVCIACFFSFLLWYPALKSVWGENPPLPLLRRDSTSWESKIDLQ